MFTHNPFRLVAGSVMLSALILGGPTMSAQAETLDGTRWRPIEIAGKPVASDTNVFLSFEAASVSAHGGCNRMGGTYQADTASLRIGPLRSTRMGCAPTVMALESAFAEALEATRIYLVNSDSLTLKSAQGVSLMRLVKAN